jgi:hypothetical protein
MSSPLNNLNKGYAKQEKSDLMNDNPIARDASSGRGSWMSKHVSKSSPLHSGTAVKNVLSKNVTRAN